MTAVKAKEILVQQRAKMQNYILDTPVDIDAASIRNFYRKKVVEDETIGTVLADDDEQEGGMVTGEQGP